jgi:hypothetical protein
MKKVGFVDSINNDWALLVFGEMEEEAIDVRLATLYQYIAGEIREEDFLEITLAADYKTIIGARMLVEETQKQKQQAIAQMNRLRYGTSRSTNV